MTTVQPPDGNRLGLELSDAIVMFHEAVGAISGLTATDHKALGLVSRHGPLSASELAELAGLTPGAVTGLVDRLERGGHVRRERDSADRRRVVITATVDGNPQVARAFASLTAAMSAGAGDYSPDQQAAIVDWIQRTTAIMKEQTRRLTRSPDRTPGGTLTRELTR